MQEVHTFTRLAVPPTVTRRRWMFGFQRRRVRRCENETLLPKPGPLPHTSQTEATVRSIGEGYGSCDKCRVHARRNRQPSKLTRCPRSRANRAWSVNVGAAFYAARCDYA